MTVTELHEIAPEKFTVGFSDGSDMRLSLDIVTDLSLYAGRELTDEEFSKLRDAARLSACKERALRIIGARPMSCRELYDRLTEKGELPENAESCVEWLKKLHCLDDAQYAGMVVRHYAAKGCGAQKIKNEFFRRGVPKELWDDALTEMPETGEKIYEQLCRKLRSPEPDRAEMKKAADALFRRGFSWDEIRAAVNRFKDENSGE